ncbi:MAG: radical SAM protein [Clostridia bacterium]|nr:radical SAM protein [Clostridia bacterium]
MEYNVNIRKEIFGATLLNLNNGKRVYVTESELESVTQEKIFPDDVASIMPQSEELNYKLTDYDDYSNSFSFADIAFLELTRGCNLKCKHCLNNSGISEKNQINFEGWYSLITQLADAGIQEIRFTGGEPLIFDGIYDLMKHASELGIFVSIGTNATLITKEVARKLKENGLKRAVVSLDGTEEMHNEIRGEGNYKKTIDAIKYLQEEGISIKVNSVIMRSNMDDVINLAKQLNREKISVFIRRFIESGRGANLKENMLSKKDYEYVNEALREELESAPYVRGHYIRLTDEGKHARIELPFALRSGCKAGQRALVITPNGDIHFCGFLAAQGFEPISNVSKIEDWKVFWKDLQQTDKLEVLENNLENYNNQPGVQPTNCLAYVQRYLNGGK